MSDEDPDDTDRTEASAERIAQLEQQVDRLQEQVDTLTPDVSRRQALQGGAAVGLGALLGGGATLGATQSARAAPDADDVGTPSDHVDVYAQNVYDVNGNQYDQFSEGDWQEDPNSPYSGISVGDQLSFGLTPQGGETVVVLVHNSQFNTNTADFQVDGITGSNYHYGSVRDGWTAGATQARFAEPNSGRRTSTIRMDRTYNQDGKIEYSSGMWSGWIDHPDPSSPQSITFLDNNQLVYVRVFHREMP
jgi:hypothetical protein